MARPPKRTKTKLEKLIMKTWYDTNKGNQITTEKEEIIIKSIKKTLGYFEMEDYLHGTRHLEIIKKVYLSGKYEVGTPKSKKKKRIINKTRIGFAEEAFISEKSLERYTNLYIKCFDKHLSDYSLEHNL
jgi:hypothetical protein